MNDLTIFKSSLEKLGIHLLEIQYTQFIKYYELLIEKNKVINLTAITDFDEVIMKHFVDSLSLVKAVDFSQELSLVDVGTGAGFPGIPLKIAFPNLQVTLLDSLNKRVKFLDEVIEVLNLEGIQAIHSRAEEGGRKPELREQFDLAVSRAVANMSTLCEYCIPFVKVGGQFIPYKSGQIEEELLISRKAIHVLGGQLKETIIYSLPNTDIERSLVVIDKISSTPKVYPRKPGRAAKEPL